MIKITIYFINLGAKPPKNKYKNYKELMKERQQEKAKEKSRIDFQQLGKNSIGKSNAKGKSFDRKRRKANSGIIDIYGKVEVIYSWLFMFCNIINMYFNLLSRNQQKRLPENNHQKSTRIYYNKQFHFMLIRAY